MGQILRYWECRVFPDNTSHYYCDSIQQWLTVHYYNESYNWGIMHNEQADDENAKLLYHCGVAAEAEYTSNGTGASLYDAKFGFVNYFGFHANTPIYKNNNSSNWVNLLKAEINAYRPVLYAGAKTDTSAGHAWVIDGYKTNNKFHCNWGWYGNYNNEWYSLDDLTTGSHNYNSRQRAVMGIYPKLDGCGAPNGASTVCSSNVSYSVSIPSSASVTWSKSGSLQQVGGNTGTTYTVKAASCSQGGSGTVTATIKNSQGGTFLVRSKNVIVSGPPPSSVSLNITDNLTGQSVQPYNMCPNTTYVLECVNSSSCSTSNYSWTLPYGMSQISASSNWVLINTNSSGGGILMVHSATCCSDCGSNVLILTENLSTDGYDCDNYYMMISPNPSNGEVTISILSKNGGDEVKSDFTAPWDVHVISVDRQVEIVKETKLEGNKYKLNTSGWKQGVYVVQAKYNDKIVEGKLMVK